MQSLIKILLLVILSISISNAQPNKMVERIKTLKKIRMIDYLKLPEEKAEKFLIKYSAFASRTEDKNKEIEEAIDNLNEHVSNKAIAEIKSSTAKVEKLQAELLSIEQEKNQAFKQMLTETEFAKYLIFEKKFATELRKNILKLRERRDR
jgi:hypothetical protein